MKGNVARTMSAPFAEGFCVDCEHHVAPRSRTARKSPSEFRRMSSMSHFLGCVVMRLSWRLDLAGVACSTGSACSSGSMLPSPVLRAMQLPDEVVRSAVRFSFSRTTSIDEIDQALGRITQCVAKMRV